MSSRRDLAASQPPENSALTADDQDTAAILAQADRDCDAGLGLRGPEATAFLQRVLDDARTRVVAATGKGD